jgi:hypothetical protein
VRPGTPIFTPRVLVLFIASAVALGAISVLLSAREYDSETGDPAGAGTHSVSAVGHAGFFDLLKRTGRPVMRSSRGAQGAAGKNGTLVLAEPDMRYLLSVESLQILETPRLLLVLPKWAGVSDGQRRGWISSARMLPAISPESTLSLVAGGAQVVRGPWPVVWPINEMGATPGGYGDVQLMRCDGMRTIVGSGDVALVGEFEAKSGVVWVVSDPDVVSNHGIIRGENSVFMLSLIDALRMRGNDDEGAPIVFDETTHGYKMAGDSPLKLLLRFPFSVVTALVCCSALLFAASGASRFGPPETERPALDFGKANLIANSARLMDYCGHHGVVFDRYIRMTIRAAAQALRAPGGMDGPELIAWLDRVGEARGVSNSCSGILRGARNSIAVRGQSGERNEGRSHLASKFETAREIHRWKGEITFGSSVDRRHS